jgi:hypothetical protein
VSNQTASIAMSGFSFSGDSIKQLTESIGSFIRWIAELIWTKNWFILSILVAIAGVFLFNPWGSGIVFKFFDKALPPWYKGAFWATEIGLLGVALVLALQTRPKSKCSIGDRYC